MEPSGIAIFCDDIREEIGGKVSLIGCYADDMQFINAAFPIGVPKLGIHVIARLPPQPIPPLQLLVYFPGDNELPTTKIEIPPIPGEEAAAGPPEHDLIRQPQLRFSVGIMPVLFKEPGFVRVRLMYGEQCVRLGALKISSVSSAPVPA